ncbi:hypothetical protein OXYTRIMIC_485 [Oxytricha trifallax]|uniref:Uncharacterized protein n=1 Tax=Oxytricha trifallax TaxID=1172189 RepID=A0A073HX72_9SPIT|nr:hypothetical protein OXYTRIMIC_485 [Oxytricha trifallax]
MKSDLGIATQILELKAGLDNEKVLPFTKDYLRGIDEEQYKEAGLALTWACLEAKSARKWLNEQEFQKNVERDLTKQGEGGRAHEEEIINCAKDIHQGLGHAHAELPPHPTQFLQRFKVAITQDIVDLLMKEALKFSPKDGECEIQGMSAKMKAKFFIENKYNTFEAKEIYQMALGARTDRDDDSLINPEEAADSDDEDQQICTKTQKDQVIKQDNQANPYLEGQDSNLTETEEESKATSEDFIGFDNEDDRKAVVGTKSFLEDSGIDCSSYIQHCKEAGYCEDEDIDYASVFIEAKDSLSMGDSRRWWRVLSSLNCTKM